MCLSIIHVPPSGFAHRTHIKSLCLAYTSVPVVNYYILCGNLNRGTTVACKDLFVGFQEDGSFLVCTSLMSAQLID